MQKEIKKTSIKETEGTCTHRKLLFIAEAETYAGTKKVINLVVKFKFTPEELNKLLKEIRRTKKLKAKFFLK